MTERIPQSATLRVPLQAYLSSDHLSPATGKTIAVTISKNGASYGNPSAGATNATEIGSGSYYVDLSTTDTGTLGPLFVLGTASGVDNVVARYNVVKATNGGFTALPDTACTTNASLITAGTGTAQINPSSGKIAATLASSDVTGNVACDLQTIKTQTVTCAAGVTVPALLASTTNITAGTITTVTNLTNAPTAGDFTATMKTSIANSAVASVTGNVGGNVGGSVASVGSPVTVGGYSSGQDPASLVLDVLASGHNSANTIGAKINAAGTAADPWATTLPGTYGANTAGGILGNRTGFKLASDGIDAIVIETGINARQALSVIGAVCDGKASGLDTSTAVYYAMGTSGTSTPRVTATTDANGNRTAITLSLPA